MTQQLQPKNDSINKKRVYKHVIKLLIDSKFIKIHYNFKVDLPEILEFEGKRLASLLQREVKLPIFDERVWDYNRKITVRKKTQ